MSIPDIVLSRIDNRLVHGQVGNAWVAALRCNLIVVADDECAVDPVQKSMMKMTADASHVGIRFFTIEQTISTIAKASPNQHIFLVVRNPENMRKLIEGGVSIEKVNVGNMHYSAGKEVLKEEHVYVNQKDLDDFEAIKAAGVEVYIQIAPGDRKYAI